MLLVNVLFSHEHTLSKVSVVVDIDSMLFWVFVKSKTEKAFLFFIFIFFADNGQCWVIDLLENTKFEFIHDSIWPLFILHHLHLSSLS